MPKLRGRWLLPVHAVFALVVVSACGGDDEPEKSSGKASDLKAQQQGQATLQRASVAMGKVQSVSFRLATEGKPSIMVKGGDLKLLRNGDAEGTLTIEQSGQAVEMKVVALGNNFHLKAVTGGWRTLPKAAASMMYDTSAVLDPERGIAKLLTTVKAPAAQGSEKVAGKDAEKVSATLPKDAIGGLIPGIDSDLPGQVWISKADSRLVKVKAEIPPPAGGGDKGSVIIDFTEFDAPYKISAPK
ncbi:LppX_LprAFG lipoprotein [Spirillospora sp. CA-294931]|uniref:LppX_LprAFG lipoprotein n=1 Tax=Spirillospora sp. CA-294931 TaxID=3240042 RepID=UPI003D8D65B6